MSTGITAFTYGTRRVRTVIGADGEPRFIAADVAAVLGYRMASDMTRRLDDDEKGYALVRTPGGEQTMSVITESGLYRAVFASKAEGARRFRRWVTGEVLPAIRHHGGYLAPDAAERALTDPDFIIRLATRLKEERAARTALAAEHAALEARVEADAPHTALGRAVADADGLVLVKAVADVLTQEGVAATARLTRAPRLTRARITITIAFPDRRRRDTHNLMPTAKAIVDGLVDAGLLPDDDHRHLVGPHLEAADDLSPKKFGRRTFTFRIAVTDLEPSSTILATNATETEGETA